MSKLERVRKLLESIRECANISLGVRAVHEVRDLSLQALRLLEEHLQEEPKVHIGVDFGTDEGTFITVQEGRQAMEIELVVKVQLHKANSGLWEARARAFNERGKQRVIGPVSTLHGNPACAYSEALRDLAKYIEVNDVNLCEVP